MATTTVKVSTETRDRLRAVGAGTLEDAIVEALDALDAGRFWAQAEAAADRRRALPASARAELAAREAELDRVLDGLG